MSSEQRGYFYAILSGFLYGFIGYFGLSAIHDNISVSNMLFWRFLIASLFIFAFMLPKIKSLKTLGREMAVAFAGGVFYYGTSTLLYFLACNYIGSGLAMVIFFTYPVMIMLLNYFLYAQVILRVYYLATVIILLGMGLLIDLNEIGFDLFGIALGLSSAFCYACYIISSKKNTMPPEASTLMVCLGCMTTSLIVAYFSHTLILPIASTIWINLLGISIVATLIPILLMLYALKHISSEKASILSVLEPVFVVIFGVLLLGETLHAWHILGIIFVLAGALLTLFGEKFNTNSQNLLRQHNHCMNSDNKYHSH